MQTYPFHWACKREDTAGVMVSGPFEDFDECYEDYCANMGLLEQSELENLEWRGVFTTDEVALLLLGKSLFVHELRVTEVLARKGM